MSKHSEDAPSAKKGNIGRTWSGIVTADGHKVLVTTDLRKPIAYVRRIVLKHPIAEKTKDTNPELPADNDNA